MRSGFAAVVGRPNVGKSTLVNRMVGSKVAITSTRPQTTRNAIRGVISGPGHQLVVVDTPGLHKPRTELGSRLNALVERTLGDVDVVVFVIDATAPIGSGDRLIADRLTQGGAEVVVAVNKTDLAGKAEVVTQLVEAAEWPFPELYPVSAATGEGVAGLVAELVGRLPEGPHYYPEGTLTDQPEQVVVAEIIREKFLDRVYEELPHSLVVQVTETETRDDGRMTIAADVVVERDSQKGIVIGKGGQMLKTAGTEARGELEMLFGVPVTLKLKVVVERDWQRRPQLLDRLGFDA
ncbi:MAG: GTPase Era [Acidimicrobiia bacterium]